MRDAPLPPSCRNPVGIWESPARFRVRRNRSNDPGLAEIASELGDLPLALELAGSYLARYRHEPIGTPAAYLAELRSADVLAHASLTITDPEAPDQSRTLTGHERDVAGPSRSACAA